MTYKNVTMLASINMDPSPYLQIFHIEPCDSSCSEGRASDAVHSHHEGLCSCCNEEKVALKCNQFVKCWEVGN